MKTIVKLEVDVLLDEKNKTIGVNFLKDDFDPKKHQTMSDDIEDIAIFELSKVINAGFNARKKETITTIKNQKGENNG